MSAVTYSLHFSDANTVSLETAFQVSKNFELLAKATTDEYCAVSSNRVDAIPETRVDLEAVREGSFVLQLVVDLAPVIDPGVWQQLLEQFLAAVGDGLKAADSFLSSSGFAQVAASVLAGELVATAHKRVSERRRARGEGGGGVDVADVSIAYDGESDASAAGSAAIAAMATNADAMNAVTKMARVIELDQSVDSCVVEDRAGVQLLRCAPDSVNSESLPGALRFDDKPMLFESKRLVFDDKGKTIALKRAGGQKDRKLLIREDFYVSFEQNAHNSNLVYATVSGQRVKTATGYSYRRLEITGSE